MYSGVDAMLDAFAQLTDAELAAIHSRQSFAPAHSEQARRNLTHDLFQYDLYDWSSWDGVQIGYVPLKLSKGYFCFVSTPRLPKLKRHFSHFHVNVQKNRDTGEIIKIYAVGVCRGTPEYVHRYLARARDRHTVVDHQYGLTLDNRDEVIVRKTHGANIANHDSSVRRSAHPAMPRGAYPSAHGYRGRIKYKGVSRRSRATFGTAEEAHAWYCDEHLKLFGVPYVCLRSTPHFPLFPPRINQKTDLPF